MGKPQISLWCPHQEQDILQTSFLNVKNVFIKLRAFTGRAGGWKPLFQSVHFLGLPSACVSDKFRVQSYVFKTIVADWLVSLFVFYALRFLLACTNYTKWWVSLWRFTCTCDVFGSYSPHHPLLLLWESQQSPTSSQLLTDPSDLGDKAQNSCQPIKKNTT